MFSKWWNPQQSGIQTSSSSAGKNIDRSDLRLVLIGGRHGGRASGKSSVGNIILGREVFDTIRITSQSVMRQEEVSGRQVTVVDTPGWVSHHPLDLTPKLTQLEIQQSVNLCPLGPHAFVLVIRLDVPYVGTGMSAEEHVRFLLSDRVWKHTMVVFTVDRNNMNTDLIRSHPEIRPLIEKCEGRFHVLNISDRGGRSQVRKLLEKIDQMVTSNGCHYETEEHVSEELKEKERTIRRRAEQRRTDAQKQTTGPTKHIGLTDLRIVLLGRKGSGKSSAGNTILTGSAFKAGQRSVQCEVRQGKVAGRQVTVVDSPGWWYNSPLQDTSEMDKLEIQNSVCLCRPGPHAALLTVPVNAAFTKAQRVAAEEHMTLLSQSLWSHSMVLFTVGDRLGDRSIEQHIEAEGEDLRWLLDKCGNRYHVFNNQRRDDTQVTQLLQKVDEMMSGNRGGHCEADVCEKMSERKRNIEEHVQTLTRKLTTLKASSKGEHQSLSDVRLMLVGGEQDERNYAGNLILLDYVFTQTPHKEFKTQTKLTQCVRQQSQVADRKVSVVICPDWSTTPPSQKIKDVLLHGVTLCSPGPHAVLVTVDVESSFSEADRRSVEEHMKLLGDRVWRNTLVLFMWGYWLGGRCVEEYIESEGEPLRWILEKCAYRYHVLHGIKWDISEVTELMEKTEDMVTRNREDSSVRDTGHFKSDVSSVTALLASLPGGFSNEGVMQVAGASAVKEPQISQTTGAGLSQPNVSLMPSETFQTFSPSVNTEHKTYEYSSKLPEAGLSHCNETGLMFKTTGEAEVLYKADEWDEERLQSTAGTPAGPLFDIKCPQGSVSQLHLPHCEVTSVDDLSVAHISDDGVVNILEPLEVTKTHVVVNVTHLSKFGLWWKSISKLLKPRLTDCQVLLFLRPPSDRLQMKVFLLPGNVPIEEVMSKFYNNEDKYIGCPADCYLAPKTVYSLHCPTHGVQPKASKPYRLNYGPNYHHTFEVTMDLNTEVVSLELQDLKDPEKKQVWTHSLNLRIKGQIEPTGIMNPRLSCPDTRPFSSQYGVSTDQPSLTVIKIPEDKAAEKLKSVRTEFVQRVSDPTLKSLLDDLLQNNVINDGEMESVTGENLRSDKARLLIDTVKTKGGKACLKMIEVIHQLDPYLSEQLKFISELRLVLLGWTGAVRSAAGNIILGKEVFGAGTSSSEISQRSRRKVGEVCGKDLVLVDGPDFCGRYLKETMQDVGLCLKLSSPGPHAFLLVLPAEPSVEEMRGMMEKMQEVFGDDCWRHSIVIHEDSEREQIGQGFLKAGSREHQQLVEKCGNRRHLLNIKDSSHDGQVSQLLEKIEGMVAGNTEIFYSTKKYQDREVQRSEKGYRDAHRYWRRISESGRQ